MAHHLDIAGLWQTYGRHLETMLSAGPAPSTTRTDSRFVALSGAPHLDLNQAAIFGVGDRRDADVIATAVQTADLPCLVAVSSTVRDDVVPRLRAAGFEPTGQREALFFADEPPVIVRTDFEVRRVLSAEDRAHAHQVLVGTHDYDPSLIAAMWGPALLDRPDVGGWVAWDGDEPVSCAYLTRIGRSLGVFSMMTPPRHRRRGAGRAVLANALAEAWTWGGIDADHVVFWASPAGRPMYEAIGFAVADEVDAWTYGASQEDLAAVGLG